MLQDEMLKISAADFFRDVYKNISATDLQYVKDQTVKFCKNQLMWQTLQQCSDLAKYEKYDEIYIKMQNALQAGTKRDIGHN